MKKLIYLVVSILCALTGIYGIYDILTTKQDDLAVSVILILLLDFLAVFFMRKFLRPAPRHAKQPEDTTESARQSPSETPAAEPAPIVHPKRKKGSDGDYVSIDIETTGLGSDARIIELGAVRIRHGRKVAEYSQLVNPEVPIPSKVTQITGITDRDVRRQPTISKALPRFLAFCGKDMLLGHNIERFDLPIIAKEAERVGVTMPYVEFVDTLEVSQSLLPQLDRHRVVDLIRYFGIAQTERHRAADDAAQTAQIFEYLKRL